MTRWLETDSLSNQNIATALAIGTYTADADRLLLVQFFADTVAGNGDYIFYATLRIGGAGSSYVLIPKTTAAAASGETAIGGQSIMIAVRSGDVVTVYLDGLAGDTTTPDTTVRWFEMAALRPTTADLTLDVSATGEAGLDFANIKAATGATVLTNITVPVVTTLTNMPAAAPNVGAIGTEIWTGAYTRQINSVLGSIGGDVAGKVLGGGSGTITGVGTSANVTLWNGDAPADLDTSGFPYVTLASPQQVRDAMKLAASPGSPSTNSMDKNITSIKTVTDQLATTIELDVSEYRFTANALELAPTGTGSGTVEPAQLNWRAWATPDGALKDLYDDNAIDVLYGTPSDYSATDGAEYYGSYVMKEFDGALFIGLSNTPLNGTGAIIARLDTPGGTPVFEYNLPEEGVQCMAVNPAGTALYVVGADGRDNAGNASIYKRTIGGVWSRINNLPIASNWQHVLGITFCSGRMYVCGQGASATIAYTGDDGVNWYYSGHITGRGYSLGTIGTQMYLLGSTSGSTDYDLSRAVDVLWANSTLPINTTTGLALNQLVNWGDLLLFGVDTDEIISVNAAGTTVSHALPFALKQTYNNIVVDTDGYLCALGTTGVWRTNDLVTWKQIWSFSPSDTVLSLGTWGDDLVVSTSDASAAILARPASPEAAQQQMYRDALKLAPSPGTAAAGSTDADIDAIRIITDAIDINAVTVSTDGTSPGAITRRRGDSWSIPLTLGPITGYTSLWFTIKGSASDPDKAAILAIKKNATGSSDGLLYVNGTTAGDAIKASIMVNDVATGAVTIAVDETITDDLSPSALVYDAQVLISGNVSTPDGGTFTITADVTRAIA